jgi:hypothetical protein
MVPLISPAGDNIMLQKTKASEQSGCLTSGNKLIVHSYSFAHYTKQLAL